MGAGAGAEMTGADRGADSLAGSSGSNAGGARIVFVSLAVVGVTGIRGTGTGKFWSGGNVEAAVAAP
jgi:hypothetical protein